MQQNRGSVEPNVAVQLTRPIFRPNRKGKKWSGYARLCFYKVRQSLGTDSCTLSYGVSVGYTIYDATWYVRYICINYISEGSVSISICNCHNYALLQQLKVT